MSDNKKENIENMEPINTDMLENVVGGKNNRANLVLCPKCHQIQYDNFNRKCNHCDYRG